MKTTFYIPVWSSDIYAKQVKKQLMEQGVTESNIRFITDKISRAISLNKCIAEATTEYVGIFDDDVVLAPNVVEVLENLLDTMPNVGFAVAPVKQSNTLTIPTPDVPASAPDQHSLENISSKMWTFNATIYRKSCNIKMDEDIFGSQLIDWDFGLELLHKGYLSIADHRTAVTHKQTEYNSKNLCYHAIVARSRHLFMEKWKDRDNWIDVAHFNKLNNDAIPTIEQITHSNEDWLIEYIARFDQGGLGIWAAPRFMKNVNDYIDRIFKIARTTKQEFNPIINDPNSIPVFK